jgi:hypothetical protein
MCQVLCLVGIGHSTQEIRQQRRPESTAQVIKLLSPCRFHTTPHPAV